MSEVGVGSTDQIGTAPTRKPRTYEIRKSAVWAVVALVAVLFGANAVSAYSAAKSADVVKEMAQDAPPEWWLWMQKRHYFDLWSGHDCIGSTHEDYEVPCPDYTAVIEFRGDREDTPPILTPAKNAKGEVVIDLKATWHPNGCGETVDSCRTQGWDVVPVFSDQVQPFAHNTYEPLFGRGWDGPRFFGPMDKKFVGSDLSSGEKVEIYAGDPYSSDEMGIPLTPDRLGTN
jgi:hypothetical protein